MYQINDDIPLGCVYESQDGSTKYCPMLNHDDVPYCQWLEDEPEAAIGIDERPVYCPILPSVQPGRKTGHWLLNGERYGVQYYRCSECEEEEEGFNCTDMKYCPNCGADMRDEEHDV